MNIQVKKIESQSQVKTNLPPVATPSISSVVQLPAVESEPIYEPDIYETEPDIYETESEAEPEPVAAKKNSLFGNTSRASKTATTSGSTSLGTKLLFGALAASFISKLL